ncbi:hypothetical protein O9929_23080 [Vibrio lentus]|nr:hypothetical protein [Vibrio lentus]
MEKKSHPEGLSLHAATGDKVGDFLKYPLINVDDQVTRRLQENQPGGSSPNLGCLHRIKASAPMMSWEFKRP